MSHCACFFAAVSKVRRTGCKGVEGIGRTGKGKATIRREGNEKTRKKMRKELMEGEESGKVRESREKREMK